MVASIALELGGKGRYAEARAPLYVVVTFSCNGTGTGGTVTETKR
jgi:hypothetical protein